MFGPAAWDIECVLQQRFSPLFFFVFSEMIAAASRGTLSSKDNQEQLYGQHKARSH